MEYDKDKVDEMTLALMFLVTSKQGDGGKAWRAFDLQTLHRLHAKGWLGEPKSREILVPVTPEGMKKAEELFRKHFQT
ncbi:hypothetical protein GX408_12620 [bacterium]|nr:hypothetical protein [bacterium]